MPIFLAPGTTSSTSSNCFAAELSDDVINMPVTWSPGRARLAAKPKPIGSVNETPTIGIVPICRLTSRAPTVVPVTMTSELRLDQLLDKHRKPRQIAIGVSIFNDVVPALDVPELLHSRWKSTAALLRRRIRACEEKADHCALGGRLGDRRQCRQRRRHSAEKHNEFAPSHALPSRLDRYATA